MVAVEVVVLKFAADQTQNSRMLQVACSVHSYLSYKLTVVCMIIRTKDSNLSIFSNYAKRLSLIFLIILKVSKMIFNIHIHPH